MNQIQNILSSTFIVELIRIISLAWFIVTFDLIINLRMMYLGRSKNIFIQILNKILSCQKCTSFWIALLIFSFSLNLSSIYIVLSSATTTAYIVNLITEIKIKFKL